MVLFTLAEGRIGSFSDWVMSDLLLFILFFKDKEIILFRLLLQDVIELSTTMRGREKFVHLLVIPID